MYIDGACERMWEMYGLMCMWIYELFCMDFKGVYFGLFLGGWGGGGGVFYYFCVP